MGKKNLSEHESASEIYLGYDKFINECESLPGKDQFDPGEHKALLPILFELPNGSALRYQLWPGKGNSHQWTRTARTARFNKSYSTIKIENPKLGLWTSKTDQHLLCADLDKLGSLAKSFDELEVLCKSKFINCIVTRSFSKKVKIFFVIQTAGIKAYRRDVALTALAQVLGTDFIKIADDCDSALQISFINLRMRNVLERDIKLLTPILVNTKNLLQPAAALASNGTSSSIIGKQPHVFIPHAGPVQSATLKRFIQRSNGDPRRLEFIKTLIALKSLAYAGFDLPLNKFSSELKCKKQTISKWIRLLVELKLLKLVDGTTRFGSKGKTYRAEGDLLAEIISTHRLKNNKPPTKILDGHWNNELFRASRFFSSATKFKAWSEKLDGIHQRGRRRHVDDIIRKKRTATPPIWP